MTASQEILPVPNLPYRMKLAVRSPLDPKAAPATYGDQTVLR
jgi:hypothetical protein